MNILTKCNIDKKFSFFFRFTNLTDVLVDSNNSIQSFPLFARFAVNENVHHHGMFLSVALLLNFVEIFHWLRHNSERKK